MAPHTVPPLEQRRAQRVGIPSAAVPDPRPAHAQFNAPAAADRRSPCAVALSPPLPRTKEPHRSGCISPPLPLADVAYVPSSENRSHGSVMGIKLRRFCDGTKFNYVFY